FIIEIRVTRRGSQSFFFGLWICFELRNSNFGFVSVFGFRISSFRRELLMDRQTDSVRIFDTTLRDGEQSPGATLTLPEKLEIARQLEALGVDVIEAGFPVSSDGDFESVRAISAELTQSVVCGLARCHPKDIERAGEAVRHA